MQEQTQFQVYSASAGSGKTFTLVKEYLKIALSTEDRFRFQNILAITFTNKAASEMKERVLENLHAFSIGETNDMLLRISDEIELSNNELQSRSKKVLNSLLQNYGAFNITTIDSFTHRIIRTFAFDLGLSLNFDVEMDAVSLLHEAVDLLISKIGENKQITEVLINYALDKTEDDKSWDISNDLKEFSKILLNENHLNHLKQLENKTVEDYARLRKNLKQTQKLLKEKAEKIGEEGIAIIESMELHHNDFYYSMVPKHFLSLKKDLGKVKFYDQSKLKERIEERNFYAKSKSDDIKTAIESILPRLLELYQESELLYQEYVLNELVLKSLIPMAVLEQVDLSLQEIKEQNNLRLHAEFNELISNQIKNEPAPFIYERIGEKFRYYFIDEMQDTSELQWQNLIPLIENSLVSETSDGQRGNLLLVGDAKQAIYRWRGGKAEQFIQLARKDSNPVFSAEKQVKNLDYNYRSYSEIIDFNNSFFSHISEFLKNEMYKEMYEEGNNQRTTNKVGGYVQISFVDTTVIDERELVYPKRVLEIIENLDERFELNDVCVLVRTKKQGITISNYLSENNVPLISSESLLVRNNEGVNFIINILSFLLESENKEALAEGLNFMSENLVEVTDVHQFLVERIHLDTTIIFDSLKDFGINFNLKEFHGLSMYDGIEYLMRSFNLNEKPNLFMQSFLDLVLEYEQKRGLGLGEFLDFWERKKESLSVVIPEGIKAVQVMTIHKSKGLEFPIVIFPYDLDIYKEIKPKVWYDSLKPASHEGFTTSLIDFSKKLKYTGTYGTQIHEEHRQELELDNLNLLYVALTRAEVQLYIVTAELKNEKDLSEATKYSDLIHHFLISSGKRKINQDDVSFVEFGIKSDGERHSRLQSTQNVVEVDEFISSSWKNQNITIVTETSKLWDTDQGNAIVFGNLVHEIMSKITTKNDIEETLELFIQLGLLNEQFKKEISTIVNSIVNHPELKLYFSNQFEIKNEQEILSNFGEVQIPDRLCFLGNNVTIIDYKTGSPKTRHNVQINNYETTLKNMGYIVESKLLIYIGTKIRVDKVLD